MMDEEHTRAFSAQNAKYTSSTFTTEAIMSISSVLRVRQLRKMRGRMFSIMFDESTDIAVRSIMLLYFRWVDEMTCEIHEDFGGAIELHDGQGKTIFEAAWDFVHNSGLDWNNNVCAATDGASPMRGKKKGATSRMKQRIPWLITIHCASHRFALCVSRAAHLISYIRLNYETCLRSCFYYFANSASRSWRRIDHFTALAKCVF